jgi:hypothetical protein
MQVGDAVQSEALVRYDVHQKAKLDVRGDNGEAAFRLKARLRADVEAVATDVDRSAASRTVVRISESIKLRVRMEAEGDSLRTRMSGLVEAFASSMTELSASFESPDGASPEALLSGVRAAFGSLLDGIRSLFGGQTEAPAESQQDGAPEAVPASLPEPASNLGTATADESTPAEDEIASESADVAEETAPSVAERMYTLRQDLHLRFTAGLRVLLQQLAGERAIDAIVEAGDETAREPAVRTELRTRFDFHERIRLHLLDVRA